METVVKVEGMTCQWCVRSLTRVLAALPGVEAVDVSLERGEAAIRHDPARTAAAALKHAIEEAGYAAS
jgi:copper chaperone CopZ